MNALSLLALLGLGPLLAPAADADGSGGLRAGLEDTRQKTLAEIAHWAGVAEQVDRLMVEPKPEWRAAAERVVTSLHAELAAREALLDADIAVLQAGGTPAQAIHPVRPFNDLTAEINYADRMLGLTQPWAETVHSKAERMRRLGDVWKTAGGADPDKVARIEHWLKVVDEEVALVGKLVDLYGDRDQPGWYDRACLAAKFDAPVLRAHLQAARRCITPDPNEALLDTQTRAVVGVHEAGRATYRAVSEFNALTTRESPLVQPSATTDMLIPTTLWDLARVGQPPPFRWINDEDPERQLLYRGEPYQGKPADVFAYYATPGTLADDPAVDRDLPALVLVHGGGDRAFRDWVTFWAKQGYAAIVMDLAGCGPNVKGEYDKLYRPQRLLRGGPGQDGKRKILDVDLPLTDQWPYHAVANAILAHSLIRSLPGVDPERTAVAGISWGGYVTCIAAGVDPRFKAAMPFYGCGFLAGNSVWKDMGLFEQLNPLQRQRWTALWDPSVYAPRIGVPIFAVTGASDFAYPLESFAKTYALANGPRLFRITPDMGHGAQFLTSTSEAVVFMDSVLRGGPPLPHLSRPRVTADRITVETDGPLAAAHFHYTAASGPSKTRKWTTAEAMVQRHHLVAPRPPPAARLTYFTGTTTNGYTVSSAVIILDKD